MFGYAIANNDSRPLLQRVPLPPPVLPQITLAMFYFFFSPYAKSYAMSFISDDAFLAHAATLQYVMNGSSRIVFGFLYDKWGYKVKC